MVGPGLTINVTKDYTESILEASELRSAGYLIDSMELDVVTRNYVNLLLNLERLFYDPEIVNLEDPSIDIFADITYKEVPEDSKDINADINFQVDLDLETGIGKIVPGVIQEITGLLLLLNNKFLDYISLN